MRFKKSTISGIIIFIALVTVIGLSGVSYLVPVGGERVTNSKPIKNEPVMNKVSLKTKDNLAIAADLYSPAEPRSWLVLVHMMPATKESWFDFASNLTPLGYESLAIDLRGHGESITRTNTDGTRTNAETLDYRTFSDEDHQKSILDLEAAVDYLVKERGATPEKISFIGASIGANLALEYLSAHPEFKTAVLLSPGLNYRGIETEPLVKKLKAGQKVFFIASRDDPNARNNAEENQKLYDWVPAGAEKKIQIYETGGHGTTLLENQSELKDKILKFLQK